MEPQPTVGALSQCTEKFFDENKPEFGVLRVFSVSSLGSACLKHLLLLVLLAVVNF